MSGLFGFVLVAVIPSDFREESCYQQDDKSDGERIYRLRTYAGIRYPGVRAIQSQASGSLSITLRRQSLVQETLQVFDLIWVCRVAKAPMEV